MNNLNYQLQVWGRPCVDLLSPIEYVVFLNNLRLSNQVFQVWVDWIIH